MGFQPGKSGNPKGRPPKHRALTEVLEFYSTKEVTELDGRVVPAKEVMARGLWDLVTTGQVELPNGQIFQIRSVEEWLKTVQFIYYQIDGPPRQELDVTGNEGASSPQIVLYLPQKVDK